MGQVDQISAMRGAEPASHWHALQGEEALELLTSTRNGLAQEEASQRLSSHGANLLPGEALSGAS